jgi:hypothetical protein
MQAKDTVEAFRKREKLAIEEGRNLMVTQAELTELKKAQRLHRSAFHPDTGEIIQPMFRMCSFTTMNVPIVFGMLITQPTMANIVFW